MQIDPEPEDLKFKEISSSYLDKKNPGEKFTFKWKVTNLSNFEWKKNTIKLV